MANISQNESYKTTGNIPYVPPKVALPQSNYTPSSNYQNLAKIQSGQVLSSPSPTPLPGSPEEEAKKQAAISRYGNLVNNGMGIPTQSSFLPPEDPNAPIPVPSDYGQFAAPMTINDGGQHLSWQTPKTPVIRNIAGDTGGQYVEDTSNPDALIKTQRGENAMADNAIKNFRPGGMYQIDHIMPLFLGGADTLANRQLLTYEQNDIKTKAQSVPYTLYAYGDISLKEAREMAMRWKDRDVSDLPQPNQVGLVGNLGDKSGIEIARERAKLWSMPKEKTLKEKIGNLPQEAQTFGKGWLPDPIRNFVKGAASGFSLGFLPSGVEEDATKTDKIANVAGMAVGGIGAFLTGDALLMGALRGVGLGVNALRAYKGVSALKAAEAGFTGAEEAAVGAKIAQGATDAIKGGTTFNSLNRMPSYLTNPDVWKTVARMGAVSGLVGQGSQFVENKFNPGVLSGKEFEKDQENMMGNMFKDIALGAVSGIGGPTLKGTAYATMLPLTLTYLANPDDPMDALTTGVMFGALHGLSSTKSIKNGTYNDIPLVGGKKYESPITKAFEETVNKASYESMKYYSPDIMYGFKAGDKIPEAVIQKAKDEAIANVWRRYFTGKSATEEAQNKTLGDFKDFSSSLDRGLDASADSGTKASLFSKALRKESAAKTKDQNDYIRKEFGKDYQNRNDFKSSVDDSWNEGMDLQTAVNEIKRITVASRQLYKGGLSGEMRNKADMDDLLSFGKNNLQNRFGSQERFLGNPPAVKQFVDNVDDSFMTKSFSDDSTPPSGQYPNGTIAVTGAGLDKNSPRVKYFLDQKAAGNASPNLLLVSRPDTAPLWNMKNDMVDQFKVKQNLEARDPAPENAVQVFGVMKNPQTGQKELYELGWVASDFRTNTGANAFNKNKELYENMKTLDFHKDEIVPTMNENGISILVANIDPITTAATIKSGKPFVVATVNDGNWNYSKGINTKVSAEGNMNPISMDIAKYKTAKNAEEQAAAISEMNKKVIPPAADRVADINNAIPATPKTQKTKSAIQTSQSVIKDIGDIDMTSTEAIKDGYMQKFGIFLDDADAADMMTKYNQGGTMKDGITLLVNAYNNKGGSPETALRLDMLKKIIEGGYLRDSKWGNATLDLPMKGSMKGVEPTSAPRETIDVNPLPENVAKAPEVAEPALLPTDNSSVFTSNNGLGLPDLPANLFKPKSAEAAIPPQQVEASPVVDKIISAAQTIPKLPREIAPENMNGLGNIPSASQKQKVMDEKEAGREGMIRTLTGNMGASKDELPLLEKSIDYTAKDIPKPQVKAKEFYTFIDKGLGNKDNLPAHYFAKSFDNVLRHIFGQKYKENRELAQFVSTVHPWGKGFFDDFFKDTNLEGKEITQPKAVIEEWAKGNRENASTAIAKRNKLLKDNETETGELSSSDKAILSDAGTDMDLAKGFNLRPWWQADEMVGNLTRGEELMPNIVSDKPLTAEAAVRDAKILFLGNGDTKKGLLQYINDTLKKENPKAKQYNIPPESWDYWIKEAKAADEAITTKAAKESAQAEEAAQELPKLKKLLERLTKDAENDPENPPASWQTPELIQEQIKEVTDKIKKYAKNDGEGGPGDGMGGMWDSFKNKMGWNNEVYVREPAPVVKPQGEPFVFTGKDGSSINTSKIAESILPPETWRPGFQEAYKANPDIPKGFFEATAMQESSMGSHPEAKSKNLNPGNWGYLMSLNPNTLKEMKIPYEDTPVGAIKAYSDFIKKRKNIVDETGAVVRTITDPTELYLTRVWANTANSRDGNGKKIYKNEAEYQAMRKKIGDAFRKHLEAYQQLSS